jgi:putative membrane protein
MNLDFSAPRKQSPAGIVVMFIDTLQKSIKAFALPLILFLVKAKEVHLAYVLLSLLVVLVLLAIFTYLSYKNFTFFLDSTKKEFVINEGVFHKTNLTIQLNKIQQVNINQSLIQQMIGVYSLEIDTAGSEKKEAKIKAIDHDTATILKEKLLSLQHIGASDANILLTEKDQPFLKLSNTTLLKVGITSNYGASIALLIGFIFGLFQLYRDYSAMLEIKEDQYKELFSKGLTITAVGILIAMALLLVLATNLVRTFLKYFDFNIVKKAQSLAINSGLLTKKNTLITPVKVQIAAYSQNYFQKKFDLLNLKIRHASSNSANKEDHQKSDIEIPGCDLMERDEILKLLFSVPPIQGEELKPNYRFLFLQVMIWIVLPTVAFITIGSNFFNPLDYLFKFFLPYIILVGVMLVYEYRHHRLYVDPNFIIKKSGIWDIQYEIVEPHKIQAITANQYFWHKKANIGHLIIHTAAGMIHFKYGNYAQIQILVNTWLYKVESSKKDWM